MIIISITAIENPSAVIKKIANLQKVLLINRMICLIVGFYLISEIDAIK